jgi:fatty-acyl-CoA synthase
MSNKKKNSNIKIIVRLHRKPDQVPYISKLDPLRFLLRSAVVYADKTAIIHRSRTHTFRDLSERVRALANTLIDDYHVKTGDRVAVLCQNITSFVDAQFAVPATGAILVPMNHRLAAKEIEYIIGHSGATVVIVQEEFLDRLTDKVKPFIKVIPVADCDDATQDPYEQLLLKSKQRLSWNEMPLVEDENAVISINYTSGSTGRPKGVMVTYRGAYLTALTVAMHDGLTNDSVLLWTLPMFHCNGMSSSLSMFSCVNR